jgi:S1-C subfamily serine protease
MGVRRLVRANRDTNGVWSDLSRHERVDSKRYFRRSLSRWVFTVVASIIVVLLGANGWYLYKLSVAQPNVPEVVDKVTKSVVGVYCGNFMGTGVVMNVEKPDGVGSVIMSAAHVFDECEEGSQVEVKYEGQMFKGKLVAKEPDTSDVTTPIESVIDLARIDITKEIPGLDPAPAANVGDWAIVVGNPLDHINYASFGIVSTVAAGYYETTAPINEGNSGGPMVNSSAQVLGIVVSTTVKDALFEGNPTGIYDQAAGMGQVIRLRRGCGQLWSNVSNCPFTD